jgi:nucleotide-binding universal stress UspA family protein
MPDGSAWTRGTNPRTILVAGDPDQTIVAVAGELGADLLVVGTKPRLLPGGPAARRRRWLHAHSPCPVLAITCDPPRPPRAALDPIPVT